MDNNLKLKLKYIINSHENNLNTLIELSCFIFSLTGEGVNGEYPHNFDKESINEYILNVFKDNKL